MICSGVSLSRSSFDSASACDRSAKKRLPPIIPATVAPLAILRKFRRPKQLQSRGCPSFWRMSDLHSNLRLERHHNRLLSALGRDQETDSATIFGIVDVRVGANPDIVPVHSISSSASESRGSGT